MARRIIKTRKETESEDIFSIDFLKELAFTSQREILPNTEKLISLQNDTRITKGKPAHYYRYLYFLAHALKPKLCVELGTWHGFSSACLADGNAESKIITIDKDSVLHKDASRPNVEYWIQNGTMILKRKIENIDILLIDAEHDGSCLKEYRFWMPRMKNKSIVLFDDINLNDAMKAFWKSFDPIAGQKFDLPIHGEAGFGAVLINN